MPDEFLTVAEIAALLKVNGQTVRNWLDRGELPGVRVGKRRVRVRRADFDAFLGATPAPPAANQPEPVVDEGSVIAWATFGAVLAEATATLQQTDQGELVRVLDSLADASCELANALRSGGREQPLLVCGLPKTGRMLTAEGAGPRAPLASEGPRM